MFWGCNTKTLFLWVYMSKSRECFVFAHAGVLIRDFVRCMNNLMQSEFSAHFYLEFYFLCTTLTALFAQQ